MVRKGTVVKDNNVIVQCSTVSIVMIQHGTGTLAVWYGNGCYYGMADGNGTIGFGIVQYW